MNFFDGYPDEGFLPPVSGATLKEAFDKAVAECINQFNEAEDNPEWKVGVPGTEMEWYSNPKLWALEDQTEDNMPGIPGLYLLIAGIHTDSPGEESWYCKIAKTENGKPAPLEVEDFEGVNLHSMEGKVLSNAFSSSEELRDITGYSPEEKEEEEEEDDW